MADPITEPGVYDLPEADYHADPAPEPSLSKSIAHVLLEKSPRHAWLSHPRLNPNHEPEHKATFDLGSTAHQLLLGGDARIQVIDAADWRTKAAKEAREKAYERGFIPLLTAQYEEVERMVAARHAQLQHHEFRGYYATGKPEQTLVWQERGIWCRARLDWLLAKGNVFMDYKSTGVSANPEVWGQRTMYDTGCDLQAAFYSRGIKAVLGIDNPQFRFLVQETTAPYAISVVGLSPYAMELAAMKVEQAIDWWRWCLSKNVWPGYPRVTAYPDVPPWIANKVEGRRMREQAASDQGEDLKALMLDWQAPTEEGEAA